MIRSLTSIVILCGLIVGCGVPVDEAPVAVEVEYEPASRMAARAGESLVAASMYLVRGERLIPVTRDLPGPPDLTAIVASLLDGPTDPEMRSQLRTAIPAGTRTLDVEVEGDIAYVDLSREFATVGGQEEILAIAQIVLTLTAVDGVEWVGFLLNGVATNVPLPDGALSEAPVAGSDYLELVGLSSSGISRTGPL
jgi:spore germination protein GerM